MRLSWTLTLCQSERSDLVINGIKILRILEKEKQISIYTTFIHNFFFYEKSSKSYKIKLNQKKKPKITSKEI